LAAAPTLVVVLFGAFAAVIAALARRTIFTGAVWGVVLLAAGLAAPVDRSVPGALG
jgi:hypothetical protein